MGWVSKQVEDVVDFVVEDIPNKVESEIIEPTKELGKSVDDFVNEEIPGGWYTVAAATGAYFAPEIAAAMGTEAGAATAGSTAGSTAGATAGSTAGTAAATEAATNYLGSQALGSASTGAVGTGATGFGLSAGTAGGAAAGTGINTAALGGMGYLGGAGNLAVGTAGLTAEQIAQAELAGQIGSNASSGLGYLGGAEALPSGAAGITGVTAPSTISIGDAVRGLRTASGLLGQPQQPQPFGINQQVAPRGMVDYSPLLSLLENRVRTPNVYSLLG